MLIPNLIYYYYNMCAALASLIYCIVIIEEIFAVTVSWVVSILYVFILQFVLLFAANKHTHMKSGHRLR